MAVKRRTIWLSDEEWAVLQQEATDRGYNISEVIRNMWVYGYEASQRLGDPRPEPVVAGFNSRPFTPVPKTRGKS